MLTDDGQWLWTRPSSSRCRPRGGWPPSSWATRPFKVGVEAAAHREGLRVPVVVNVDLDTFRLTRQDLRR